MDLFISPPVDGLGAGSRCFVTLNKAALNVYTQVFVWTCFYFSWVNTRSDTAWSFGMCTFNFIRNCPTRAVVRMYTPTSKV